MRLKNRAQKSRATIVSNRVKFNKLIKRKFRI